MSHVTVSPCRWEDLHCTQQGGRADRCRLGAIAASSPAQQNHRRLCAQIPAERDQGTWRPPLPGREGRTYFRWVSPKWVLLEVPESCPLPCCFPALLTPLKVAHPCVPLWEGPSNGISVLQDCTQTPAAPGPARFAL